MADKDSVKLNIGSDAAVYTTRKAALAHKSRKRGEGIVSRTVRLVKGLKAAKVKVKSLDYCSAENVSQIYGDVFRDAYAPVFDATHKAADTLWNFLYKLWYDLLGVITLIINLIIKIFYYVAAGIRFVYDKLWDLRLWADVHKKAIINIFSAVVITLAAGFLLITSMSAYEYSYYGRTLGTARTKREVYETIDLLGDKLAQNAGANISFNAERDIEFKRVYGLGIKTDSQDDILNTLTYMSDIHVVGYAIKINGREVAVMDKPETAEAVIEAVKNYFAQPQEGYEYTSVSIADEIEIEETNVVLSSLWNPEDAARYIETGSIMETAEEKHQPMVTVYASATVTYDEETAYGVEYRRNNKMFLDEIKLISEGKPGIQRIVALVQTVNGKEVSRLEQSNTTISEPVDAVYYQGTMEIPSRSGSGTWIFPLKTKYVVTDGFGARAVPIAGASSDHKGVDLSTAYGASIYAADGGIVTFSGYQGSYGRLVKIDHGGGYETWYAHCSELLVKVGEDVYQGKVIAKVGSSGRSTGPHLHFEVHYKGVAFDPLSLYKR